MAIIKSNANLPDFPSFISDFFDTDRFFGSEWLKPMLKPNGQPATNIAESDTEFIVEVATPGMARGDISVQVENGVLTISGEKKSEEEEKNKDAYTRREFSYRSFKRSFSLPDNVDDTAINAKYTDGILKLRLPKKAVEADTHNVKSVAISQADEDRNSAPGDPPFVTQAWKYLLG